jgi:sterol desaturase/sphingolipid hydroxylase (fatty acid hydroxylase superfamily)
MLTVPQLYHGWLVFWASYVSFSFIFPTNCGESRPGSKMTQEKVFKRLLLNYVVTGISVPFISYIPQILSFPHTWVGFLLKFVIFSLMVEIWFYYTHRLMHHKYFYRWHTDHHVFIQPYALAALYCSPIEMIFVNQMSVIIPYQLLGFSFHEILITNIFIVLNLLRGHAGFYFMDNIPEYIPKNLICSLDHDIHHRRLKYNFGILYLLDRLHGTYKGTLSMDGS